MGAVIVRRALLDLEVDTAITPVLSPVRLLFFAPAHKGSHLPRLIAHGLGLDFIPGAVAVTALLTSYYRSIQDLEIGSPSLNRLEEDTVSRLEVNESLGRATHHLVAAVLHAQHDKVVSQEPFAGDPPMRPVMQASHRSVCKPQAGRSGPIEAVVQAL
jgi:hypothetical protein